MQRSRRLTGLRRMGPSRLPAARVRRPRRKPDHLHQPGIQRMLDHSSHRTRREAGAFSAWWCPLQLMPSSALAASLPPPPPLLHPPPPPPAPSPPPPPPTPEASPAWRPPRPWEGPRPFGGAAPPRTARAAWWALKRCPGHAAAAHRCSQHTAAARRRVASTERPARPVVAWPGSRGGQTCLRLRFSAGVWGSGWFDQRSGEERANGGGMGGGVGREM